MEIEASTSRRPSRRAAVIAAKKISECSRNDPSEPSNTSEKQPETEEPAFVPRKIYAPKSNSPLKLPKSYAPRVPKIEIGLKMECEDCLLSQVQAEAIFKAQLNYNAVMKKLRDFSRNNVKIYTEEENGQLVPADSNLNQNMVISQYRVEKPTKPVAIPVSLIKAGR